MKLSYFITLVILITLSSGIGAVKAQDKRERRKSKKVRRYYRKYNKEQQKTYELERAAVSTKNSRRRKKQKQRQYKKVNKTRTYACQHESHKQSCKNEKPQCRNNNYAVGKQPITTKNYQQKLPSQNYFSFYQGNEIFYHCQNRFYSYHPGRGYININLRLSSVTKLPQQCRLREINGCKYPFNNGYYYIPYMDGYYRISTLKQSDVACQVKD